MHSLDFFNGAQYGDAWVGAPRSCEIFSRRATRAEGFLCHNRQPGGPCLLKRPPSPPVSIPPGMKAAENMNSDSIESLSPSLEDYLEVIFHLEQTHRVARAKDIADHMSVQRASVTGALKALSSRGLINYSPYSYITLTGTGRSIAQDVIHRHDTLKEFFMTALQLEPEQAEANACRIEHAIGPAAIDRLVDFLEFIKNCPRAGSDWLAAFASFCRHGIQPANCKKCLQHSPEQPVDNQDS
jgi:DtxR family transcriptional regulator, Mn-dependent transcriptional regulator